MSATWGKQNPDARARLAQSAERKAPNLVVVGSRPTGGWITFLTPGQKPEIGIARLARAAERKDFSIVVEVSGGNWLAITHLPTHLPTRDRFASRFSLDAGHDWQTGRIHVWVFNVIPRLRSCLIGSELEGGSSRCVIYCEYDSDEYRMQTVG